MKQLLKHITLISLLGLFACEELPNQNGREDLPETHERFYVLCEGLFNLNNGTLAYWDGQSLDKDYFLHRNGRGLGDTPNDIKIYGGKMYLIVNVSSQIEVVDLATGRSLKRIPMFLEDGRGRQPRHIAFHQGKAYITCFDGTVARLDTTTLSIEANTRVGRHPEGLAVANGKLYVANSGGLDNPHFDHTLSVIDLKSFQEIKKIEVALNPYKVYSNAQGDIYVNARGNNRSEEYCLQKINTQTDSLVKTFEDLHILNFVIQGNTAYLYDFDFGSKASDIFVMDMEKDSLIRTHFITDDTQVETPYGLSVNPFNGNVYLSDACGYVNSGDILCFSPGGKLQYRLKDVGLNPNAVIALQP